MSRPRQFLPSGQVWLIDRMKKIIPKVNEKGICFGLAAMSMQGIFSNDLSTFTRRLELINAIPEKTFAQEIAELNSKRIAIIDQVKKEIGPLRELNENERQALLAIEENRKSLGKFEETIKALNAEEKNRRKKSFLFNMLIQNKIEERQATLPEDERIQLDIPVFLQGLQTYHQPESFQFLFEEGKEPSTQDIMLTYPLVASKELEEQGGISKLRDFSGVYTVEKLTQYFNLINQVAEAKHAEIIQRPLVLILQSTDHAIAIGYHPDKRVWSFTDANQLPTKYISDIKELANDVMIAFLQNKSFSQNEYANFSTEIYTKEVDKNKWEPLLSTWENDSKWKDMHAITPKRAKLTDSDGVSWLYLAAQRNDIEKAKALIEKGANPNQARKDGAAPLFAAAATGNAEMVKLLLDKEANPNQTTKVGSTPLYNAALLGHVKVVNLLLENGANPNKTRRDDAVAPLFAAVLRRQDKIVKMLLDKGANPDQADKEGDTPLYIAVLRGQVEIVKMLLDKGANPNQTDNKGNTLLSNAFGHAEITKILVEKGADHKQVTVKDRELAKQAKIRTNCVEEWKRKLDIYLDERNEQYKKVDDIKRATSSALGVFGIKYDPDYRQRRTYLEDLKNLMDKYAKIGDEASESALLNKLAEGAKYKPREKDQRYSDYKESMESHLQIITSELTSKTGFKPKF